MYENFFGLKEKPFSILPDPEYLYWSQSHELAFAMLEYGLLNHIGFTVITGEVGCGKTTLLRYLLGQLGDDVVVGMITNPPEDGASLLEWILMSYGEPVDGRSQATLYADFRTFTARHRDAGNRVLLIVDEAQNLGQQTLERLRMLSNINVGKEEPFQLILVGQPQLKEMLRRPEMAQFAQRVGADFHLRPLDIDDVIGYIAHRLAVAGGEGQHCFTFDAVRLIYRESGGVPRLVNTICDTSLVYGFARNIRVITAQVVEEVIKDKIDNGVFDFANSRAPYSTESNALAYGHRITTPCTTAGPQDRSSRTRSRDTMPGHKIPTGYRRR
jgi:general secretion pathway protein A